MAETSAINNSNSDDEFKSMFDQCEKRFRYGDTAYVEERYSDAIQCYSTVLQETEVPVLVATRPGVPQLMHLRFQCHLHRSIAYQQTQKYTLAYTDVENAMQLYKDSTGSSITFDVHEIHLCYRQYGHIMYQLQKYSDAQSMFEKILQEKSYNPNDIKYNEVYYQDYLRQCHLHIDQQHQQQLQDNDHPIPMDTTPSSTTTTPPTATSTSNRAANDTKINPATLLLLTPKYQYYQNDTQMVIQIIEPNLSPSDMTVQYIDAQNIFVCIRKQGHSITIIHGELYDTIVPDKCSVLYKSDKVVIKLRKERPKYEWQTLLSESNKTKAKKPAATLPATRKADTNIDSTDATTLKLGSDGERNTNDAGTNDGTTRSKTKIPQPYASHRDWDAIGKDVEQEIAKETPVGDEAMNQLFQQIYANADEDTKRAMIKSYQTSGGTVLSTNWNEVAQKDYEQDRTAPEGQEWKTWEGDKLSKK